YDKTTLQPLAIVNQAGQQININNGVISQTQVPLSPDLQKLITDVFQQKFTDNGTNTKTATAIGSSTADNFQSITFEKNGIITTATFQTAANGPQDKGPQGGPPSGPGTAHVPNTLTVALLGSSGPQSTFGTSEILLQTGKIDPDHVGGFIQYTDI